MVNAFYTRNFEVVMMIGEKHQCWHAITAFEKVVAKLIEPTLHRPLGVPFRLQVATEKFVQPVDILKMAQAWSLAVEIVNELSDGLEGVLQTAVYPEVVEKLLFSEVLEILVEHEVWLSMHEHDRSIVVDWIVFEFVLEQFFDRFVGWRPAEYAQDGCLEFRVFE